MRIYTSPVTLAACEMLIQSIFASIIEAGDRYRLSGKADKGIVGRPHRQN
jgi:hypothetical protein